VPVITGLSIPDAPQLVLPVAPVAPGLITEFALPSAPVPDYGSAPAIADLNLPTYVSPALPVFNDAAPEFNVLPPDPFIQWTEPQYSSDIKDAVKLVLQQMLAGGTGLPADVEQAIWERARGREGAEALKVIAEAMGQWASRGYAFPPGELNKQIQAVRDETERKVNEHSREVMIKQAELEQTNRNFAVTQGIGYEQVFVGLFMQIVDRNFQIAKFAVETQIQIFNLKISAFNVQRPCSHRRSSASRPCWRQRSRRSRRSRPRSMRRRRRASSSRSRSPRSTRACRRSTARWNRSRRS
jgi:hypothetical protein